MSMRQAQNTGTREVREAHRFEVERLEAYMTSHVESFRGPLAVTQFKGGQSNPTYLLDSQSGRYVLRRKPPGKLLKSAHAVDREFRVISALYASGFPVPRPYVLCEDDEIIGTAFYVMECVEGRIFWELDLPGLDREERAAIYDNVNETIARLHTTDFHAAGLNDFGVPGNYFEHHYYTELAHSAGLSREKIEQPGIDPKEKVRRLIPKLADIENTVVKPDGKRRRRAIRFKEITHYAEAHVDANVELM